MIKFNEQVNSSSKMNSISLYVTTNQIILKADPNQPNTWQDLYRLLPYLRNSLCCVVCSNLLVDPQTPSSARCHHHLCRKCKGGRKKLKPACTWCRNCVEYSENKSLRILLQCYQQMCHHLTQTVIYKTLIEESSQEGAGNLLALIKEGSDFHDEYKSEGGIPKSTYNILPCVYTNSSTQTTQIAPIEVSHPMQPPQNVINLVNPTINLNAAPVKSEINTNLYSVMYPSGTINKITIKRKPKDNETVKPKIKSVIKKENEKAPVFKRPVNKCIVQPKKGCRCGNATATPGKLTCCGQRCPCYVESKACIECRCRGCRNPHTPDGLKVRPVIPDLPAYQVPQANPQAIEPQIIHHHPSMDLDPHFSFDPVGMKTYKVVTGNFTGLPITSNLIVNTPILEKNSMNLDV